MDENKLRFGVGVLVISAIGIGIILVFLFGEFFSVSGALVIPAGDSSKLMMCLHEIHRFLVFSPTFPP